MPLTNSKRLKCPRNCNRAPGDFQTVNSKFSLVNLHWKYMTHAYITSSTIVIAAIIIIITLAVKDRITKRRAAKRKQLPSFNSTFRHLQQNYMEYEIAPVTPFYQGTPWTPGPPLLPGPQAPRPKAKHPMATVTLGRHKNYYGGETQAPHPLTWNQQPIQAVTRMAPKPIEYQLNPSNISPEYQPNPSNMSPAQNEVEVIASINTPLMEVKEGEGDAQLVSQWGK